MKQEFAKDPSLDRVLLISRADLGREEEELFDPLHPVYSHTEGTNPFTYRNDFCQMRLTASGTVEWTQQGAPERFAAQWQQLFAALGGKKALSDLRIYDYGMERPPAAVALTTYGRVCLFGETAVFSPCCRMAGGQPYLLGYRRLWCPLRGRDLPRGGRPFGAGRHR